MTFVFKPAIQIAFVIAFVSCVSSAFGWQDWEIVVTSTVDAKNVPVRVVLEDELKDGFARSEVLINQEDSDFSTVGQVTKPSLLASNENATAEIHFHLAEIAANEEVKLTARVGTAKKSTFDWKDADGKKMDLKYGGTPVLRYMHEAPDWSTKERLGETYKVYHHVYSPDGSVLLTKGPGGLFPHHRGLFFGFNKITYGDGKQADVWHCKKNETQEHASVISSETGPFLGRHRLEIDWHGQDKEVFAKEHREMTAYNVPGGRLIEFATRVETLAGPIQLKGDPQHAGFQFRATQHVPDSTKKRTYYVRPDGKGEPGKFRNWPDNKEHVDLAWNALSIVVNEQRYTIGYLDRPENPKQSRFSERDYGRFGSYFEYKITEEKPLELNYRIWVQDGEMTVEEVAAQSANFVNAPKAVAHELEPVQ